MTTNITSHSGSRHNGMTRSLIPMIFFVLSISTSAQIQAPQQGVTGGPDPADNGVVGNLLGIFSQSPSGAMIYTVPFPVLPGTNGMTPELNLIYNSQSGNGLLGMGFHLGGLSSIARIGSNLYNDGEIKAIQFSYNDHFALDGNRLTLDVGTYGASGSEYHTESQTFSKIIAFGTQGNGPEYFKVFTKSGLIYWYGYSQDSRIEGQGLVDDVLQWRLNRVEDRMGNYIDYYYYENKFTGENLPIRISYTGNSNTSSAPYYHIVLNYSDRLDSRYMYLSGCKVNATKRLENISLYYGESTLIWEYQLTYKPYVGDVPGSFLQMITYQDDEGNEFNPLEFEWVDEGSVSATIGQIDTITYLPVNEPFKINKYPLFVADVENDGMNDLIGFGMDGVYVNSSNNGVFDDWNQWSWAYGTDQGYPNHISLNCQGLFGNDGGVNKYGRLLGDYNGDGMVDIFGFGEDETHLQISNGLWTFTNSSIQVFDYDYTQYPSMEENPRFICDVNGDNRDDIVGFSSSGMEVMLSTKNGSFTTSYWSTEFTGFVYGTSEYYGTLNNGCKPKYPKIMGDVNGDGLSDVIVFAYNNTYVRVSNGKNAFVYYDNIDAFHNSDGWGDIDKYPRFINDVNGDGLGDIVGFADQNVVVAISTGTGFLAAVEWSSEYGTGNGYGATDQLDNYLYNRLIADINGDGMGDIICFTPSNVYYSLSTGTSFTGSSIYAYGYSFSTPENPYQLRTIADINGDGQPDLIGVTQTSSVGALCLTMMNSHSRPFINKVTDSYDNIEWMEYAFLSTSDQNVYYDLYGPGGVSDVVVLRPPLSIIKSYSTDMLTTEFAYSDARFHKEGKGFLGFGGLRITTTKNGLVSKTYSKYKLSSVYVSPYLSEVTKSIGNINIMEMYYDVTFANMGGKSYFFWNPEIFTIERDPDNNPLRATKTTTDLDSYGNIIQAGTYVDNDINHSLGDNISTYQYSAVIDYDYYTPDIGNWIFLCSEVVQTKKSPDDPIGTSSTTAFVYFNSNDPRYPLLQQKEFVPQGSSFYKVVESFDYDDYGNLVHQTTQAPNFIPATVDRITEYWFGQGTDEGRFLKWSKEYIDGSSYLYKQFSYYSETGLLKTEGDYNGLITEYTYDDFGRLIHTLHPDGTEDVQALRWSYSDPSSHPDAINGSLYYHWTQSTGGAQNISFYDSYRRLNRNVIHTGPNEKIYADRTYNTDGQLFMVTEPYFSTDNDYAFTEHYYDNYGRPDQTIVYGGNPVTVVNSMDYDYNGLTTTLTSQPSGQFKQVTKNIIGQDVSIVDDLSTVEYIYNALGKPTIINAGGAVTKIEYDYSGQQSLLEDPNAGITTYIYSPFGDLINQVDALGNSFDMAYDATGRLLTRMNSAQNQTIEYVYDVAANGAGLLASVSGGDLSYEINYTYDNLSRLESETEAFDGHSFSKTYHYDQCGRISSIDLPSGYSIGNTYSGEGLLTSVNDVTDINNPIPLWNYGHMSARGAIEESQLGNSLDHLRTYNNLGLLLNITVPGLQDLDYEYDFGTGNMTLRRDNIASLEETFDYDHNRLHNIYAPNGTQTIDFDDNGNILENSELGSYNYDPNGKPHAVLSIDNPVQLPAEYEQNVEYNSENNLAEIHHVTQEKDYYLYYGGMSQRIKSVYLESSNTVRAKYYALGNHEVIVDDNGTMTRDYIGLPDGTILVLQDENSNGIEYYYILTDHLGSLGVVTDNTGQVYQWNNEEQRYSFDAWGRRRDPDTWSYLSGNEQFMFERGYTGHEHLDAFGLINMNGRTYDPIVARFLMPDNYVAGTGSVVYFNRYVYCLNNPLKYTDPSGEIVWMPIIIGAAIGGFSGWMMGDAAGATGWDMAGYIAGGALIGGLSGGAASGISAAGGGAMLAGAGAGTVGGAGFSGLATGWDGQAMLEGAAYGALSGFIGGGVGAAIGGGGGAFAGGAVGSGLNAKLYGASWEQAGIAALGGGTMAFGAYHASSYLSWKFSGGNNLGGHDISYRQYTAMQADFQRSRFWNREYGGYLLEGGGVHRSGPGTSSKVDLGPVPAGEVAFAEYHTHWDKPGITRYVLSGGDGTYVDPAQIARETPVGQRVALDRFTTSRYHGDWDYNTGGRPSFVINRYDGSYFSGSGTNYSVINPPMNRFIYSFFFWR